MEASLNPPRIVGRYALFDAFASGGMASVHLGRLLGPVGFSRTVAIKRLHESFANDPDFVAMFLDEARIVARIRHPNVVPTLDVVAHQSELLLVMEYISGESLSLLLKRARAAKKPVPIPVMVDIVISVLNGLHAAHEATNEQGEPMNIVHRDVSPQNILVGTDGVARVLDFGIAKAVGRMHQTRHGQVKGKAHYMPPEQLTGKGVTRAVDIYAASVVLWEALTGGRVFSGDNDAEVMYSVLEGKPVAPSTFRADVPRALDDIILCGLRSCPADRFTNAEAMANALEAAVPPVARSAVANWVLEVGRDDIQRRLQRVAEVERDLPSVPSPPSVVRTLSPCSTTTSQLQLRTTQPDLPRAPLGPRRIAVLALAGTALLGGTLALSLGNRWMRASADPVQSIEAAEPFALGAVSVEPATTTPAFVAPFPSATSTPSAAPTSSSSAPRPRVSTSTTKSKAFTSSRGGDRLYKRE